MELLNKNRTSIREQIKMTKFSASEILDIEVIPEGRAGVWFLNWKINVRPLANRNNNSRDTYSGPGLYGLCFNGKLIYIGSFLGNERNIANFSGDVAQVRWWTHIGAITARGNHLHIAPSSLSRLRRSLGDDHVMVAGFLASSDYEHLHKDGGNLGPYRRLQFAAKNHDVFFNPIVDPIEVLNKFCFVYTRVTQLPEGVNGLTLKAHVENAEKNLISRLAPICNSTHVPKNLKPVDVNCDEIELLFRHALSWND